MIQGLVMAAELDWLVGLLPAGYSPASPTAQTKQAANKHLRPPPCGVVRSWYHSSTGCGSRILANSAETSAVGLRLRVLGSTIRAVITMGVLSFANTGNNVWTTIIVYTRWWGRVLLCAGHRRGKPVVRCATWRISQVNGPHRLFPLES